MRVLGAIDLAPGRTERDRIRHVAGRTLVDEYGHTHAFTWRTIETWLVRYRKHGVTVMHNKPRSDKGALRKVVPETVLEAVQAVLPSCTIWPPSPPRNLRFICSTPRMPSRSCSRSGFLRCRRRPPRRCPSRPLPPSRPVSATSCASRSKRKRRPSPTKPAALHQAADFMPRSRRPFACSLSAPLGGAPWQLKGKRHARWTFPPAGQCHSRSRRIIYYVPPGSTVKTTSLGHLST